MSFFFFIMLPIFFQVVNTCNKHNITQDIVASLEKLAQDLSESSNIVAECQTR